MGSHFKLEVFRGFVARVIQGKVPNARIGRCYVLLKTKTMYRGFKSGLRSSFTDCQVISLRDDVRDGIKTLRGAVRRLQIERPVTNFCWKTLKLYVQPVSNATGSSLQTFILKVVGHLHASIRTRQSERSLFTSAQGSLQSNSRDVRVFTSRRETNYHC